MAGRNNPVTLHLSEWYGVQQAIANHEERTGR